MLYLNAEQVRACLPMNEAINAMKSAFIALSNQSAVVPPRNHISMGDDATALFMPVYIPEQKQFAVKVVSVNPVNKGHGLPLIHATVLVHDADTGVPLAIMDGASLTAIRTGAASGLATDLLALQSAYTVAIFGAGVQSRTQLEAVCTVRPINRAYIFDTDPSLVAQYINDMSVSLDIELVPGTPADISKAQVICTATTSDTPILNAKHIAPGTHINAVGSYKPKMQEIPSNLIATAQLYTDSRSVASVETGDLKIPLDQGLITLDNIHEIGELAAKTAPGRASDAQITIFKSVGNAAQDLAAAGVVIERAKQSGIGQEI